MTKRYFSSIALLLGLLVGSLPAVAAEGPELPKSGASLTDQASLQRGAKLFFNYCVGCHSLKYMRYSRIAEDLGLSEQEVMQNLNFTGVRFGQTIESHMPADDAAKWFGKGEIVRTGSQTQVASTQRWITHHHQYWSWLMLVM